MRIKEDRTHLDSFILHSFGASVCTSLLQNRKRFFSCIHCPTKYSSLCKPTSLYLSQYNSYARNSPTLSHAVESATTSYTFPSGVEISTEKVWHFHISKSWSSPEFELSLSTWKRNSSKLKPGMTRLFNPYRITVHNNDFETIGRKKNYNPWLRCLGNSLGFKGIQGLR